MRVVHVLYLQERLGRQTLSGAENHLWVLLPSLVQAGVSVELLAVLWRGSPSDELEAKFSELRTAGVTVTPIAPNPSAGDITRGDVCRTFASVWRALWSRRSSIVHLHLELKYTPLIAKAAGCRRIIVSIHNDAPILETIPRAWYAVVNRVIGQYIAISGRVKTFFLSISGAAPSSVSTIYYGLRLPVTPAVSRSELGIPEDRFVVGFVGRLTPQKNLLALLDGVRELPEVILALVGSGPQRHELQHYVEWHQMRNVIFLGGRPGAERLMPAFDVLCLPSAWEGLGLVLIEAMLRRVPIIGSSRGAIPEILGGGAYGTICEPSAQNFRAAIIRAMNDTAALRETADLAFDYARQRFTSERMAAETIAVYSKSAGLPSEVVRARTDPAPCGV